LRETRKGNETVKRDIRRTGRKPNAQKMGKTILLGRIGANQVDTRRLIRGESKVEVERFTLEIMKRPTTPPN